MSRRNTCLWSVTNCLIETSYNGKHFIKFYWIKLHEWVIKKLIKGIFGEIYFIFPCIVNVIIDKVQLPSSYVRHNFSLWRKNHQSVWICIPKINLAEYNVVQFESFKQNRTHFIQVPKKIDWQLKLYSVILL